ncbi:MAG: exodeoxyribonuclease VII small subunit [Deltaproteobacteria bacterium]|nr:MAG: exodeoxyribonuclease VII small subunit [Deltaproteobacteria bacterium]
MELELILKKLEILIKDLEQGDLPIEKSLQIYEEGIVLAKKAEEKINNIQGKIEKISSDGEIKPF